MWELIVGCMAAAATCLAHSFEPQVPYIRFHQTMQSCVVELDRVSKVFKQGGAAYRFRCERQQGRDI